MADKRFNIQEMVAARKILMYICFTLIRIQAKAIATIHCRAIAELCLHVERVTGRGRCFNRSTMYDLVSDINSVCMYVCISLILIILWLTKYHTIHASLVQVTQILMNNIQLCLTLFSSHCNLERNCPKFLYEDAS